MRSRKRRGLGAWALLICTFLGALWLASPAAFAMSATGDHDEGAGASPTAEEGDERSEELETPSGDALASPTLIARVRCTHDRPARSGEQSPLERPPRT